MKNFLALNCPDRPVQSSIQYRVVPTFVTRGAHSQEISMIRITRLLASALAILCLNAATSGAAEPEATATAADGSASNTATASTEAPLPEVDPEQRLRIRLSMYTWLSSLSNDVTTGDSESSSDIPFSDVLDATDFANFAHLEMQRGKWSLFSELDFVKLSQGTDVRIQRRIPLKINADAVLKQTVVELGGMRSFDGNRVGLDALVGARYFRLDSAVNLGPLDLDVTEDWLDPMVGARLRVRLSERWNASLRGDLAGFGAGSELTTNVVAIVSYTISDRYDVGFGYRYMKTEYEKGDLEVDMSTYGPILGMAIKF
jgi:hypothetical protein